MSIVDYLNTGTDLISTGSHQYNVKRFSDANQSFQASKIFFQLALNQLKLQQNETKSEIQKNIQKCDEFLVKINSERQKLRNVKPASWYRSQKTEVRASIEPEKEINSSWEAFSTIQNKIIVKNQQ